MGLRVTAICVTTAAVLVFVTIASAHGPCPDCIRPDDSAQPGERLEVDYPTIRAVWNPPRPVLERGPKPDCYGCQLRLWRFHNVEVPSSVVFTSGKRQERFSFTVPRVPPGRYLVSLFDGGEGGVHYTWDFVEVTASAPTAIEQDPFPLVAVAIGIGVGGVLAGVAVLTLRRPRSDG